MEKNQKEMFEEEMDFITEELFQIELHPKEEKMGILERMHIEIILNPVLFVAVISIILVIGIPFIKEWIKNLY